MRVLVLGGYGLIGQALVRRLVMDGHEVVGLGRDVSIGQRQAPDCRWIKADIAALLLPEDWAGHLEGVEAVVNASGALQSVAQDGLEKLQAQAITALIQACEAKGDIRFIHISAPGTATDATTAFMRTKASADDALRASNTNWTIVRPGVVIAPNAFGGTALLRMLAAFPLVVPIAYAESAVGTASIDDVAEIVSLSISGTIAPGSDITIIEDNPKTLRQLVLAFRRWLGYSDPVAVINVLRPIARLVSGAADLLGYLRWRSPLRTTSMRVMADGVIGEAANFEKFVGRKPKSIDETLAIMPATLQERWFARLALAMPIMVATLSLFWIVSGAVALARYGQSVAMFPEDLGDFPTLVLVVTTSLLDIVLGAAILYRPTAKAACLLMIAVTILYLLAGTAMAPMLWLDPLGPFVKTFPAALLAWVTSLLLEER